MGFWDHCKKQITTLVDIMKKHNSEKTTNQNIKVPSSKEDGLNSENITPNIISSTKEALAPHLLSNKYPINWKRHKLPQYKGNSDPVGHIHKFLVNMEEIYGVGCLEEP